MRQLVPRSLAAFVASMSLFGIFSPLAGCAYVDSMLQRSAPPDTRVKLGWQDHVFVSSRDAAGYTCQSQYLLICEGGGAMTLSCSCALQ